MKTICMMVTNTVTNDNRVIREASSLALNGYEVTILGTKDNQSSFKSDEVNTVSEESYKGFKIKRLLRKFNPESVLGKLEFIWKFAPAAFRQKAQIYHSHDLNTLLECYIAARLRHAKIVYDSHEIFVNQQAHNGHWLYVLSDFVYSLLERLLIGRVDEVITVNSYIANYLENRYHLKKSIFVVMNCPPLKTEVSSEEILKTSKCLEELRAEKQRNKKIVLYEGGIVEDRGLKNLVEAMNYLPEDYSLFIIGGGNLLPELKDLTIKHGLSTRVFFTGLVNVDMVLECTKFADIGVTLSETNLLNNYYSSPNKLFQYIHAGIPVIARNYPFLRDVIEGCDIGCLVDNIEPAQIAAAIRATLQDEQRYSKLKANISLAQAKFNWEEESKNLLEVYRNVEIQD